jgi:ribonuclease-3
MRADLASLEAALEHRFEDREILDRALTHRSYVNERLTGRHNEQLEFLGDSILGFLVSDILVRRFSGLPEGRLSKMKAHLVSAAHLLAVARKLNLGLYLQIGRGEELSGGRSKPTLLVDALEAVIAAMYLDAGLEPARRFLDRWVLSGASDQDEHFTGQNASDLVDFKSALQEWAHSRKLPQPRYVTIRERGPEHSKTFTVEVRIGKEHAAQGDGATKKSAAQKAAREMYEQLQETSPSRPEFTELAG